MFVKKSIMAVALSLCTVAGIVAPAFAADEPMDKVVDGALIVPRVAATGASLVIGTPVAILRQTYKHYIDFTSQGAEKIGGKECGPACAVVSVVTIPAAVVVGGVKGFYIGNKNAYTHGFNEPFSPASFSITKDYED